MEEEKSNINNLVNHVKEYVETSIDLMKTEAVDRIATAASSLASSIILAVTGIFFLLFASVGCAWLITKITGSAAIGFFSIAGFYLLISIIIYTSREKWIKIPIVNITGYDLKEASLKTAPGFNLGIFSSASFSKYFSLQPEINLNIQNSRVSLNNELSNVQFNMLLSYIEFTIAGRVNLGKLYAQAGPYISYLANTSISDKSEAVKEMVSRKNFYDIDYGFAYSGGIQLKRWDLGIRYNHGIYKIGKPYISDNNLNIFRDSNTSSFQLYTGYYFLEASSRIFQNQKFKF